MKAVFFIFSVGILVYFAALRSMDVGIDVRVYIEPYSRLAKESNSFIEYMTVAIGLGLEMGYAIINYISSIYLGGIQGVFASIAILIVVPVYIRIYDLKKTLSVFIVAFIYLLLFYNLSLNIARQSISISLVFFASKYIFERPKKFSAYVLLAMLFHTSAIIAFTFLIIYKIIQGKFKRIKTVLMYLFCLIGIAFYNELAIFLTSSLNYFDNIQEFLNSDTGYLSAWNICYKSFMVVVVVIAVRYLKRIKEIDFIKSMIIFDLLTYFLTFYNGNCFRYGLYFHVFTPVAIGLSINAINRKQRYIVSLVFLALYIMYWFNFNILTDSYGTIPYYFNKL